MPVLRVIRYLGSSAVAFAAAAAAEPQFLPVLTDDFADPFVVEHQGEFIAYSTNARGRNLPMAVSRNLVEWRPATDAAGKPLDGLPVLGPWAKTGYTWAPEVMQVGGRWLLYYTAAYRKANIQCLGVAIADNPKGPFRDSSPDPLVCQESIGGTIDANPFRDSDGKLYLYFKNDGNRIGRKTELWGQQLSADGASLVGQPVSLHLANDAKWEAHVIEAPSMVRSPAGYVMFYSANHFGWEKDQRLSPYAMGYATCTGPLGPCKDARENPILYSYREREAGCLSGPGHQAPFQARGRMFVAFHAWAATSGCRKADDERHLYVAPLSWSPDGKPIIAPSLRSRKGE